MNDCIVRIYLENRGEITLYIRENEPESYVPITLIIVILLGDHGRELLRVCRRLLQGVLRIPCGILTPAGHLNRTA